MDSHSCRRRRRFIVSSSSDDDDGGGGGDRACQPPAAAAEAILSVEEEEEARGPSSFPNPNNPLVISSSDDDDDHRHHDAAAAAAATALPSSSSSSSFSSCSSSFPSNRSDPVEERLRLLGLRLRSNYYDSRHDTTATGDGTGDDAEEKARLCFERFLFEDMNLCGAGVLPPDLPSMHDAVLEGPFVLQVDEIVNLSLPLRERYRQANPGPKRCLKLLLSDGVRHASALEYRPIKDLDPLSPVGLKVVLRNVLVRHGLLMLVPEVFQVLGGVAEDLELARQRLVLEISKPYRGKRKQEAVSLSQRASRAAWPPSNGVNNHTQVDGLASGGVSPPPQRNAPEEAGREELTPEISRSLHEGAAVPGASNAPGDPSATRNIRPSLSTRNHNPSVSTRNQVSESAVPLAAASSRRSSLTSNANLRISTNNCPATSARRVGSEEGVYSGSGATPVQDLRNTGPSSKPHSPHIVEEEDQPALLTDAMEVPFTYMTSLQAKWNATKGSTPSIRGKIKCFLTGVKGFQFRDRDTFELQVYVDDGSQIFEVIVDHIFVQGIIGNSPRVVSAALSSSDGKEIADMKETMRNFQRFLSNFEGVMTVELNKMDSLPVARKLTQGCLTSDVHLLMSRLVLLTSTP